ncbi:MAG: hypothetical protein ACE149_18945 [Armatimonadota bacterium]
MPKAEKRLIFETRCQRCQEQIRVGYADYRIEHRPDLAPVWEEDKRAVVLDMDSESDVYAISIAEVKLLSPTQVWRPMGIERKAGHVYLCRPCAAVIIERIQERVFRELHPAVPIRCVGEEEMKEALRCR